MKVSAAIIGGVALLAAGVCYYMPKSQPALQYFEEDSSMSLAAAVEATKTKSHSGVRACGGPHSSEWQSLSTIDPKVKVAAHQAIALAEEERKHCAGGPLPPFAFRSEEFLKGSGHSHTLHVQHKWAKGCKGETFRLHFIKGRPPQKGDDKLTHFVIEAFRDVATDAWAIVKADPAACLITTGTPAGMQVMTANSLLATTSSEYAAKELEISMKKEGCLGAHDQLKLKTVRDFRMQVVAGRKIKLVLEFTLTKKGAKPVEKIANLNVFERCDAVDKASGGCQMQLVIPRSVNASVCTVLQDISSEAARKLLSPGWEGRGFGHIEPDGTDAHLARLELLESHRRLQAAAAGTKSPMLGRQIKNGAVPASFDMRSNECYTGITVYDQGVCGSCYANAVAQMTGIRQCLFDKGYTKPSQRRLRATSGESTEKVSSDELLEADAGRRLAAPNPWANSVWTYMPSVNDLAQCANDGQGNLFGCDGGNPQGVWDNWMTSLGRPVWNMKDGCDAYSLKCWNSGGVVNPLTNAASCARYKNLPTFLQPCSCIDPSLIPTAYSCVANAPSSGCQAPTPSAAFSILNVANGLSNADAVLNYQRHIQEFGPIYVAFLATDAFVNWNWATNPIYTGCTSNCNPGGHAVIATGWGTQSGTDYWIIRNSWSPTWAMSGYGYFQRGINLDSFEGGQGAAAFMPTTAFHDWTAPVCDVISLRRGWSQSGTNLVSYQQLINIKCNKAAIIVVSTTNAKGAAGATATQAMQPTVPWGMTVDLVAAGFGLATANTAVTIVATDSSGNTATVVRNLPVPAVKGVTAYGTAR